MSYLLRREEQYFIEPGTNEGILVMQSYEQKIAKKTPSTRLHGENTKHGRQ